ncbi:MAG TPA: rhomboid family intramembrane serine protease [Rectinemataceae bacterium]|nr:rhomboid family intramembrane serine protease [Rectinemataceae bacterium]
MLPIGDQNSCGRGSAVATWSLIAINVAVFIFIQGFGADLPTLALAAIPSEIARGRGLLTLITSQFAHGGLAHLAGNMLFLGIFGDNVECRIGRGRFIALYLISGTIGVLAHVAAALAIGGAAAEVPLVGASAAISGILAAYLVLFPGNKVIVLLFNFIPTALSAWIVIGFWFFLQLAGGLSGLSAGGTAYLAHIGGFVSSWLWSRGYKKRELAKLERAKLERLRRGESGGVSWWVVDDKDSRTEDRDA